MRHRRIAARCVCGCALCEGIGSTLCRRGAGAPGTARIVQTWDHCKTIGQLNRAIDAGGSDALPLNVPVLSRPSFRDILRGALDLLVLLMFCFLRVRGGLSKPQNWFLVEDVNHSAISA